MIQNHGRNDRSHVLQRDIVADLPTAGSRFTLHKHGIVDRTEIFEICVLNIGSRYGDIIANTLAFYPEKLETRPQEPPTTREEFERLERDRREIVVFTGTESTRLDSLVYKACCLVTEAINLSSSNHLDRRAKAPVIKLSDEVICCTLANMQADDPLARSLEGKAQYVVIDDDGGSQLVLTFERIREDAKVSLAILPYGDDFSHSFVLREPVLGGTRIPEVRSALLCLTAALKAER